MGMRGSVGVLTCAAACASAPLAELYDATARQLFSLSLCRLCSVSPSSVSAPWASVLARSEARACGVQMNALVQHMVEASKQRLRRASVWQPIVTRN
jgi:hypothetical protein